MTSFLEPKNSMSISIFLKKTRKWPMEVLIDLIRRGKSKEITLDSLTCLKKILPEKTEVDDIRSFCKDASSLSQLSEPDQFIKLLSDIPRYDLRIDLMNFLEEFDDMYTRLDTPLKVYSKSANVVLNNEALKEFLSMVLRLGNYLNTNSYKGSTMAFKMSSLSQLQDLKGNRGSITSLHFLVEQFEKNHKGNEQMFEFLADLKEIGSVMK